LAARVPALFAFQRDEAICCRFALILLYRLTLTLA
jgi:hypothetical protein